MGRARPCIPCGDAGGKSGGGGCMMHLVDVSGVSLDCDGENRCDGDDHDDDSGAGSVACSGDGGAAG